MSSSAESKKRKERSDIVDGPAWKIHIKEGRARAREQFMKDVIYKQEIAIENDEEYILMDMPQDDESLDILAEWLDRHGLTWSRTLDGADVWRIEPDWENC